MRVLAEITKRVLRTAERAFCVNHPWGAEQWAEPRCEGFRIPERSERSMECEFVLRVQRFQAIHEFSPEHFFEVPVVGEARRDPAKQNERREQSLDARVVTWRI